MEVLQLQQTRPRLRRLRCRPGRSDRGLLRAVVQPEGRAGDDRGHAFLSCYLCLGGLIRQAGGGFRGGRETGVADRDAGGPIGYDAVCGRRRPPALSCADAPLDEKPARPGFRP